jgi:hypothetical protein
MAVSSVLRPESIVGRQPQRTPEQFQDFLSGGSSIGSSVIQNAANKIVGFQRASVRPVVPDINSIISSISNNIVNNIDNSIRNATNISNQNNDKKIEVLKTQIINMIEQIKTSAPIIELREQINNLQTKIVEVERAQQPEQIREIVTVLQTQINELKNTDPAKQLDPVIRQIQAQIQTVSNDRSVNQIQNVINNIQNQVSQIEKNIQNIQSQTNLIQTTNDINEVKNIVRNVQTQINNIQTQVNTIQTQPIQQPQQNINPITQIQNVVQNIQTNVNQTLQQTIDRFTSDYRDKIKQVDSAEPSGILGKFLDVYKTAIGFVQFFGNKKNIDRLRSNLVALKESFTESFEVAKLVRQTIIKIVKQLSNLPKANASGGAGLNIDLDIPGGPLRKSAPRGMTRRMGGRAGMLGLGLGGMALGGAAVNALQDSDMVQPLASSPEIPQNLVDRFSAIVDRFSAAVEGLIKSGSQKKREEGTSSSGGSAGAAPSTNKPSSPGSAAMPSGPSSYSPGTIPKEVSQDTSFTKGITDLAKKYNVPEDYLYAVMGFETGGTFSPSVKNKAGSGATGLIQFMPETAKGLGTSTDSLSKMTRTEQLKYVDKYFEGTLNKGGSLSDVYMSVLFPAAVGKPDNFVLFGKGAMSGYTGTAYTQNAGLDLNKDGSVTKAEAAKKVEAYLPKTPKVSPAKGGMGGPSVDPSMIAMDAKTLTATAISQPPKKSAPTVNVLPMNLPTPGQGQSAAPKSDSAPIPTPASSGQSIPIIPSSNPDNFLVLYSKLVYNIVDG